MIEQERDKYQRVWAHPDYRRWSPGEAIVPVFLERLPWQKEEGLLDLGCGTGRAGKLLHDAGLRVLMIDLCREAVEVSDIPFMEACLWELPAGLHPREWVFCVDVLEHLPPDYIGSTLDDLAALTIKGGLLKIACFEDGCGAMIGEPLHLTVQPALWWLERIKARWEIFDVDDDGGYLTAFVGARRGKRNRSVE